MITNQCISITDFKKNPHAYIKDLRNGSKYIFVNNKPVAVISDIANFNISIEEPFLFDFGPKWIDPKSILDHFKYNGWAVS